MSSQLEAFKAIDDALCIYYARLGYSNYHNVNGNGIFLQYIIDDELIDDDLPIEDELGNECDPSDCAYSWINNDINFPIPPYVVIDDDAQKEQFIFYVLQYCYKNSNPPSDSYIIKRILPQIQGDITSIFGSEPMEHDRWDDVSHNLTTTNNGTLGKDHQELIDHCRTNKWSVHDDDINEKIDPVIKQFVAEINSIKLYKSFTDCILSVRQRIQCNEINCSEKQYDKRYKIVAEIIENIQRICASNNNSTDFPDEQLKRLCVSFDLNDILLISDLISKIMCQCINYGQYKVVEDKCFEKIFNQFVRYEFVHYLHDKLKFNQYFDAMRVLMQKRYLSAAKYGAMIKRIKTTDEKTEDDDGNDAKIDLDLRATQICILSFIVTNVQYLLNQPFNINCTTALNIESPPIGDKNIDFDTEMSERIDLFNKIFENQQSISVFDDNMKKHHIAYWTVNASNQEEKSKETDVINLKFIGKEEKDIGISLDEKEYKENYEDNRLFHIIRAKKILCNKIGVSIHRFVDKKHQFTIKMYWHYNGSVIPFTLKDICCSKWYQSAFNSSKNALTENIWMDVVNPYLMDIWMEYKFEHKSNNLLNNIQSWSDLDKELEIKCDGFIKRMSYYSDLFKIINDEREYNDDIGNENTKCTEIVRYKSKYPNIRYPNIEISDTFLIGLWCDISRDFPKESHLRAHIYDIISSQIETEEMIVFIHNKQEKAMFALGLYDKYEKDSLYGIMARDYDDKMEWILDEYKTSKEILTYYTGLNKLPQLDTNEHLQIITIKDTMDNKHLI